MNIPKQIDFSLIKPKGYDSQIFNREFNPAPFNENIAQQDLIRFTINQNRGFWDPYSAYIDCEVDFTGMSTTGVQQLDGSAHSLISRLQIYVNGTSVELIDDYDSLMHTLHDMQCGPDNKRMKLNEGVGISEINSNYGSSGASFNVQANTTRSSQRIGYSAITSLSSLADAQKPNQWLMDVNSKKVNNNTYTVGTSGDRGIDMVANQQFVCQALSNIEPKNWNHPTLYNGGFNGFFDAADNAVLCQQIPLTRVEKQLMARNCTYSPANPTSYLNRDFQGNEIGNYWSGTFCDANFEQIFTTNYKQLHVKNGNPGAKSVISSANFQFPLGSSLFGVLMPPSSYKYIPFKALGQDLVLEFTMNKYAFFTSGYVEDVDSTIINTTADLAIKKLPVTQQPRQHKIKQFNLVVDIIIFSDESIEKMVNQQILDQGILFHTCQWTLALKTVFQNSAACTGNFQINYGFESLKMVMITYESNEYQRFTGARKHFKCSRGVEQLQLRIGEKLYPQEPLTGHGGNALKYNNGVKTNQKFLQQLYRGFNKQWTVTDECQINMANFAPNKRTYDTNPPLNRYFPTVGWTMNPHVSHVNLGQSLLWENQVRGMATYVVSLDSLGMDQNAIGGVDTKNNVPFNVLIKTDITDSGFFAEDGVNWDLPPESDVTGQFWCYADVLFFFKGGQAPQKIGAQ